MVWNMGNLSGQTWTGNTFFGDSSALAWRHDSGTVTTFDGWRTLTGFADPGTYAGTAPEGVKIVVRPNQYEPGRANIIVYNWAQQSTVSEEINRMLDLPVEWDDVAPGLGALRAQVVLAVGLLHTARRRPGPSP